MHISQKGNWQDILCMYMHISQKGNWQDIQALSLSGFYQGKPSITPPSCTKPKQPTMYKTYILNASRIFEWLAYKHQKDIVISFYDMDPFHSDNSSKD